jgi:hypothetical protein
MKIFLLVSLLFGIAHAVVPLYKQCGGWNYNGDRDCGPGKLNGMKLVQNLFI